MQAIIDLLNAITKSNLLAPAVALALWPVLGMIAMKALQAPWMVSVLGRSLSWARSVGTGIAAMPKTGILRVLFAPAVYIGVYAIAVLLAGMDGILSKTDPQTAALVGSLIDALKKAGANDSLLYLQHKTMEPEKAAAVKIMQEAMVAGGSVADAAQIAVLTEGRIPSP